MIDKIKIKDFLGTSINRVSVAKLTDKVNEIIDEVNTENPGTYKSYVALLNQTGSTEPVATELGNTLGAVTWLYVGSGQYKFFFPGDTNYGKAVIFITNTNLGNTITVSIPVDNTSEYSLECSVGDDTLINTPFEIRLYN